MAFGTNSWEEKESHKNDSAGMRELSLRNHILQIFIKQTIFAKGSPPLRASL